MPITLLAFSSKNKCIELEKPPIVKPQKEVVSVFANFGLQKMGVTHALSSVSPVVLMMSLI